MKVLDKQFPLVEYTIGIIEAHLTGPDGFHFSSDQYNTRHISGLEVIFMKCCSVPKFHGAKNKEANLPPFYI